MILSKFDVRLKIIVAIALPIIGLIHLGIKAWGVEETRSSFVLIEILLLSFASGALIFFALKDFLDQNTSLATLTKLQNGDYSNDESGEQENAPEYFWSKSLQHLRDKAVINNTLSHSLDVLPMNVLVTDSDLNIIHINQSCSTVLDQYKERAKDKASWSDVNALIGTNVNDVFPDISSLFSAPSEEGSDGVSSKKIEMSGAEFEFLVTPIRNQDSEECGYCV